MSYGTVQCMRCGWDALVCNHIGAAHKRLQDRAEKAEAEVTRLRAALEALHNHVMSAAPLTWAAACDTASAHLWEIHLDDIEEAVEAALVSTSDLNKP